MILEPFQKVALADHFAGCPSTTIIQPKKLGKALALDTPVPTPDGWSTQGALALGDIVFTADGKQTEVIATTETWENRPCYKVEFSDGTSVVADAEHEWLTHMLFPEGHHDVWTTAEIARTLRRKDGAANHTVPAAGWLECPDAELLLDPYVLGVWLGGGHKQHGTALHLLRDMGLIGNKHIPAQYLRGSYRQRLALLQGMMDTDGHCVKNGASLEYTSTSRPLADGIVELIRSLGLEPRLAEGRVTIAGRDCGPKYRVTFCAPSDTPVFRLRRKASRQKDRPNRVARSQARQIVAVDPVPSVPVRCITVADPSGMYLVGEGMVPTHNSTVVAAVALHHALTVDDCDVIIVAVSTDQAKIVFRQARGFINRSEKLQEHFDVKPGFNEIRCRRDLGRIRVMAADESTLEGVEPTLGIIDEYGQHSKTDAFDPLNDGIDTRHGQLIIITNAGSDEAGPLGVLRTQLHSYPDSGHGHYHCHRAPDGSRVLHEWALLPHDDWEDLELVKSVNPASWMTKDKLKRRRESAATLARWQRMACGIWVKGGGAVIQAWEWDALESAYRIARGANCFVGLDFAFKVDHTAIVPLHWVSETEKYIGTPIILKPPGEDKRLDDRAVSIAMEVIAGLRQFDADAFITTLSDANDPHDIEQWADAIDAARPVNVTAWVYDPNAGAEQLIQAFQRMHKRMRWVEFEQKAGNLVRADMRFMESLRQGTIHHDGNRDLREHVLNAVEKVVGERFYFGHGSKPRKPNDGLRAVSMANDAAVGEGGTGPAKRARRVARFYA